MKDFYNFLTGVVWQHFFGNCNKSYISLNRNYIMKNIAKQFVFYRGLFNLVNHLEKMTPNERLSFSIRSVVLLKCLKASGFFPSSTENSSTENKEMKEKKDSNKNLLTENESYIARLLFHFQTGIQYNLHAIYQVIIK